MQSFDELARPNISEALVVLLRKMIVDGALPAGERVNEVHLARDLGVSRTPLREALGRMVGEGALTIVPRYGYYVSPLTFEEFRQIYQIRPILDPEALRVAGIPDAGRLDLLHEINRQILAATDAEEIIKLDDRWHLELLAGCPNRVLVELIEQNIRRTRRYELALMRESRNVATASDEHERIIAALRAGDLEAGCRALRRNMESGFEPIAAWLKARENAETIKNNALTKNLGDRKTI
jgi:DNA-binding GntR family transcriptional regulator